MTAAPERTSAASLPIEIPIPAPPRLSAAVTTTPGQRLGFVLGMTSIGILFLLAGAGRACADLNALILSLYFVLLLYRVAAVCAGVSRPLSAVPRVVGAGGIMASGDPGPDESPPLVSILVPLYHEASVVEQIVGAIERLQYPADRLEALLLLEEDDCETIAACEELNFPSQIRTLVVPQGAPRTKPRACNYGLNHCHGEIVVVYDAEDQPEADQVWKAVQQLGVAHPRVACVQARLSYYNPHQNLLTRWFAAEYMSWFEVVLPGLEAIGAPVPLGGTSNHFRADILRRVGGWDPWNVAEDCDLGVRLYREGYRVELLDSTTWEEACVAPGAWIRQRSRWVKGYFQTWLVHSRQPSDALRSMGLFRWLQFHLLVGGSVLCSILNPVFWLLTTAWIVSPSRIESSLFLPGTLAMGSLCLFFGNLFFAAMHVVGPLRRRRWSLVLPALLLPIYWVMMSIAAWKALGQLLFAPHYWEKTTHGLARMPPAEALPGVDGAA